MVLFEKLKIKLENLFEYAYRRRNIIEEKITDQYSPLVEHLVKIYLFRDKTNLNGWLRTLRNIMRRMVNIVYLSNVKITKNTLKNWLKFDSVDEYIKMHIDWLSNDEDYASLEISSDADTVICFVKKRLLQIYEIVEKRDVQQIDKLIEDIKNDVVSYNYIC